MTPEGKVKEKVRRILKKVGAWFTMPRGGPYGRAGVPDFLCCYRGYFLAIECKAGDNQPTDGQLSQIAAVRDAGGLAIVVRESNIEDLPVLFKRIDKRIEKLTCSTTE